MLLAAGADVAVVAMNGHTALTAAKGEGHAACVALLEATGQGDILFHFSFGFVCSFRLQALKPCERLTL